jgi:hypothetical protein
MYVRMYICSMIIEERCHFAIRLHLCSAKFSLTVRVFADSGVGWSWRLSHRLVKLIGPKS